MSDGLLKARLEQVADLVGGGIEPPDPAVFGARRRARRRVAATVLGAVAIVVTVAATATVLSRSPHPSPRHTAPQAATPRSASLPTPQVSAATGGVGAAELTAYHWGRLPDAPIAARSEGVVGVWTGSDMLVWGGSSRDGQIHADGASYDPTSKTWQKMPAAPLGPRDAAAYTWTGHDLFIWGGRAANNDGAAVSSGALYDPEARSWHALPQLELSNTASAVAVWTGTDVVLLTAAQGQNVTTVEAHAYHRDTDSWTTLPSIHITQTDLLDISALVAGDRLYVWMPVQTLDKGLRTGNDGFLYQPASNTWTATDLLPTQGQYSVGNALWTGDHIVFEPNGLECSCGGLPGATTGSWADPRTGTVTTIAAWQDARFAASTFTWTGDAVLAVGSVGAAAWNPATTKWTALPSPPYQGGAVQIWTGTKLLIWGQLSDPPSRDPSAGDPRQVTEPTGLELTR